MNGFYTRFTEDGESKERFTVSAVVKGKKFVCTDAYGDRYKYDIDAVSGFSGNGSRFCIQTTAGIEATECIVNCSDYFEYRNADGTRKYPDVNDIFEIFAPQATTKDDERELTKKIERIIYSTMEGSYIRTAFDGCVQDALDNINFDFAMSWKARAESQDKQFLEMCDEKAGAILERDKLSEQLESSLETIERLQSTVKSMEDKMQNMGAAWYEISAENADRGERIEELEAEVMKLKAKLYDMMTQGI